MKHLKISGNIVLDTDNVSEFKKELFELMKKYSKTKMSSSCKVITTQNLDNISKDKKYKAGMIFKLNLSNPFDYHVILLSVSTKICIAAIVSDETLSTIKAIGSYKDIYYLIEHNIVYMYFDENNIAYYGLKWFDDSVKEEKLMISEYLEYKENLDENILANIVAKLKDKHTKKTIF